jgi:glycosyltransferase involved in cell wall biosynthesis
MIAQIVPWKRHDLFLKAASILVPQYPNLRLLIVGKDPWGLHGGYYEELVRLSSEAGLKERVTFLGQREDVGTILAASDLAVLPSEKEPFGRVVVEAFWSGTPIVVSDDGAPADLVTDGETGLHFRSGDAEDLASKIHIVLSNQALGAELSRRGKRETAKYDVGLHADRVAEAYREILL